MDLYHVWCNLKSGVSGVGFCEDLSRDLGSLRDAGRIRSFRVTP